MSFRSRPASLSRASRSLVSLAEALSQSSSHLEDSYWESHLSKLLDKSLCARRGRTVEAALDHLLVQRSAAYDLLVELAEARSESLRFTKDEQSWDALLISAPFLAWTRYRLPSGKLLGSQIEEFSQLLHELLLAPEARLCLLPELMRYDRLPQSFPATRNWTQALANKALGGRRMPDIVDEQPPADLLADAYFLIGVVVVPSGQPLFRWQSTPPEDYQLMRHELRQKWAADSARILETSFTGCSMEYLPPEAYHSNTRQADKKIRPLALKAALSWLQTAVGLPVEDLRSTIIACGDQGVEEYRIGFCTRDSNDVIYGCIWPALSREEIMPDQMEDDQVNTWDTIAALLREAGMQEIRRLPGIQGADFCDDCGTPYFPNMLGEMQHPELPEEVDIQPVQLH